MKNIKNTALPFLLPIRCIIFTIIFIIASFITGKNLNEITSIWSIVASAVNIFLILLLVLITRKNGSYKKLINYEKGKTTAKQVILMIIIVITVGMSGMYLAGFICYGKIPYLAPMMIAPIPLWLAIINFFVLPITTAIAEDGLYLGCGVNQIKNKTSAIIVPAFFFALQHSFIPVLFDWKHIVYRFLSFFPLTIILCIHYRKHRNPLPIMIGHAVIDVFTVAWILATSISPSFYEMLCNM